MIECEVIVGLRSGATREDLVRDAQSLVKGGLSGPVPDSGDFEVQGHADGFIFVMSVDSEYDFEPFVSHPYVFWIKGAESEGTKRSAFHFYDYLNNLGRYSVALVFDDVRMKWNESMQWDF